LLNIYRDYTRLELLSASEFRALWHAGEPARFRVDLSHYPYEKCRDCGWRLDGKCFGGCKVWQSSGLIPKLIKLESKTHAPHPAVVGN
jgi:hypothetical protein